LALIIALYVAIGIAVHRASKRLGLADGRLIAADQSLLGMTTLYAERLRLAGRPDQLLRVRGLYCSRWAQAARPGHSAATRYASGGGSACWWRRRSVRGLVRRAGACGRK